MLSLCEHAISLSGLMLIGGNYAKKGKLGKQFIVGSKAGAYYQSFFVVIKLGCVLTAWCYQDLLFGDDIGGGKYFIILQTNNNHNHKIHNRACRLNVLDIFYIEMDWYDIFLHDLNDTCSMLPLIWV